MYYILREKFNLFLLIFTLFILKKNLPMSIGINYGKVT